MARQAAGIRRRAGEDRLRKPPRSGCGLSLLFIVLRTTDAETATELSGMAAAGPRLGT
jgi:hypothetical protein